MAHLAELPDSNFGPPMPNGEFKALKTHLLEQVHEKHKTWLREKLCHNSRTLRTKLLGLQILPDPK